MVREGEDEDDVAEEEKMNTRLNCFAATQDEAFFQFWFLNMSK